MKMWYGIIKRVRRREIIVGCGWLTQGIGGWLFPRRLVLPPGPSPHDYHPYALSLVESRIAINRRPRKRGGS